MAELVIQQAGRFDLTILPGKTFRRSLYFRRGRSLDAPPAPLTGWAGRGAIRARLPDDTLLARLDVTVWQEADGPNAGRVDLYLSPEETAKVTRSGVYDVELYRNAEVMPFVTGRVTAGRRIIPPSS